MIDAFYTYYRSSAAYRVRIALNVKQIVPNRTIAVNLLEGEQLGAEYGDINPARFVPAIRLATGQILTQSMAIIEYLDETVPQPALLPRDAEKRAEVRAFAQAIACDIHPLNNARVLRHLHASFGTDEQQKADWYRHWIEQGFSALELQLVQRKHHTPCCFGNEPGLADIALVPQVYNAERYRVDLSAFPTVLEIATHCRRLPAFRAAAPEAQPDCPADLSA